MSSSSVPSPAATNTPPLIDVPMVMSPTTASPTISDHTAFPVLHQYETLSHGSLAELREAFILLADAETGKQEITLASMQKHLATLGQQVKDEQELKDIIAAADQLSNGTISFPEFVIVMAYRVEESQLMEMKSAFLHFDRGNSGFVTRSQFCELFAEFGLKSDSEEVEAMLASADVAGSEKIDYMKWLKTMAGHSGIGTSSPPATTPQFGSSPSMSSSMSPAPQHFPSASPYA